jgi:hypothetical protein
VRYGSKDGRKEIEGKRQRGRKTVERKNTNDTGEREERRGGKEEGEGEEKIEGREAEARQRYRYKGEI